MRNFDGYIKGSGYNEHEIAIMKLAWDKSKQGLVKPATKDEIEKKLKEYEELVINNCKAWFEHKITFGEMSDNLSGYRLDLTESLVREAGKS